MRLRAGLKLVSDTRVGRVGAGPAIRDGWRRGKRGWPASFPVAQLPNTPLLVALGGRLVAVATGGPVHVLARAVFYAGLTAWAWQELVGGVNWARRALGAAGVVYVVAEVRAALGE